MEIQIDRKHWRHHYFVPGIPLWSYWGRGQIFCADCKHYFYNDILYLKELLKWEIKNIDNRIYNVLILLKIWKYDDEEYTYKCFFQKINAKNKKTTS